MSRLCKRNSYGFALVESIIAVTILAIVIIAFSLVTTIISETSSRHKKKIQSNLFAEAVIENLKLTAELGYEGIRSDEPGSPGKTYKEITGREGYQGMTCFQTVTLSTGCKVVDIKIQWTDPNGAREEKYQTRITPSGLNNGGIIRGRVVYIKQLDENSNPPHRSPAFSRPSGPYDEPYASGAGGMTVTALSNDNDGSWVTTLTDNEGYYLLKNIKVGEPLMPETTVYFYKEGSFPNCSADEYEPGYYFFVAYSTPIVPGQNLGNIDFHGDQSGKKKILVEFVHSGEIEDIETIYCARAWTYYLYLSYKYAAANERFQAENYTSADMIKFFGPAVLWGRDNVYQTPYQDYWDFSGNIETCDPPHTIDEIDSDRGDLTYNLVLRNIRGGYPPDERVLMVNGPFELLKMAASDFQGSSPEIPDNDNDFAWSTMQSTRTLHLNPVTSAFIGAGGVQYPFMFNLLWEYPGFIAPILPSLNTGFPMGINCKDFINTLSLAVNQDPPTGLTQQDNVYLERFGWITGKAQYLNSSGNWANVPNSGNSWFKVSLYDFKGYDGNSKADYYVDTQGNSGKFEFFNMISPYLDRHPENDLLNERKLNRPYLRKALRCYGEHQGKKYYGLVDTVEKIYSQMNGGGTLLEDIAWNDPNMPLCPYNRETEVLIKVYDGVTLTGTIKKGYDVNGNGTIENTEIFDGMFSIGSWISGSASSYTPLIQSSQAGVYTLPDVNRMSTYGDPDYRRPFGVIESTESATYLDADYGVIEADFIVNVHYEDGTPVPDGSLVKIQQHTGTSAMRYILFGPTKDPYARTGVNYIITSAGQAAGKGWISVQ
ncbi:MAG: hypothetical protein ABII23_07485, partial [bacterium]